MGSASRAVPRLRQRIVARMLPITRAPSVVVRDISHSYHIRRVRSLAPGTLRQVLDLAQSFYATPLDMSRPLWEAILVEGVDAEGGQAALFWKLSHSITDGVGGVELDRQIRSYERDPERGPMPPLPVPEDLEATALTRKAALRLPFVVARETVRRTGGLLGAGGRALRSPPDAIGGVSRFAGSLGRSMGAPPVDPSPLL